MDGIVKFKAESGEEVALSPEIIKRYLVSGDPSRVTDQEVMMFLKLCQYQRLNPFLNEAYLVKFGNEPAQIIVGKDVFMRRLSNSPLVEGYQAGIIVRKKGTNDVEYRNGTFYISGEEELLGGWSKIWRKGWKEAVEHSVSLHEYIKLNSNNQPQAGWKKAATQIRKVALVQNAREVVPDLRQLYISEEMQVDEEQLQRPEVQFSVKEVQDEEDVQNTDAEVVQDINTEVVQDTDAAITEKQAKRLYAIAKGNTTLLKSVLQKFGYEKTQDIRRNDYKVICDTVQSVLEQPNEDIPNTAGGDAEQ
jgi:phage recombination protein Bet